MEILINLIFVPIRASKSAFNLTDIPACKLLCIVRKYLFSTIKFLTTFIALQIFAKLFARRLQSSKSCGIYVRYVYCGKQCRQKPSICQPQRSNHTEI